MSDGTLVIDGGYEKPVNHLKNAHMDDSSPGINVYEGIEDDIDDLRNQESPKGISHLPFPI
jgi:hypothetical protein